MKLLYIVNARIPTEKAHGFQIVKMCASFVEKGCQVELVVPHRRNTIETDAHSYYGVPSAFTITYLAVPDLIRFGALGYYLHVFLFACAATWYALRNSCDVVYSRDVAPLFVVRFFKRTVLEVHNVPQRFVWLYAFALKRINRIISTNAWKKDFLISRCGISSQKIIVLPNAIDPEEYMITASRVQMCAALGLRVDQRYVVYTGHLYDWKGAYVLAEAAQYLPNDTLILFVGGAQHDIDKFRAKYPGTNLQFTGMRPHIEVPQYLAIADVVVLPNVPVTRESELATSPMKLFEYMAAGRPIVASDLPSVREIVDEACAILVAPGDARALANAIALVFTDPVAAARRAEAARTRVMSNTWSHRAEAILKFIV